MSDWANLRRVAAEPRLQAFLDAVANADYTFRLQNVTQAAPLLASHGNDRLSLIQACTRVMQQNESSA